jgi:branched-chain amino acid transport system ATP-binding protein
MSIKFQIPGIFPQLTVLDHINLSLFHNKKGKSEQADKIISKFNLEQDIYREAGQLSHGKKQWLEMAMAVSLEPDLLLLDEPVAGLSIEETWATGELIKKMQSGGLTIMVVEHDMSFVRQIATKVTVLHAGRVFAEGATDEVLTRDDVADIYLGKSNE